VLKLSVRSRYGIRAMLVLAINQNKGPLMSKGIAEKQGLPATYLEQLMLALRKANLVTATRGAHGGYTLARDAKDINLAQIIEALDGAIEIADCADTPNCSTDLMKCALKDIFEQANKALRNVFESVSLAELAERQRGKEGFSEMYYI
jgi:Rrf2 family transcriptional regulator, cysteine metabolism repressor